jgi:hypothetical protein
MLAMSRYNIYKTTTYEGILVLIMTQDFFSHTCTPARVQTTHQPLVWNTPKYHSKKESFHLKYSEKYLKIYFELPCLQSQE